RVLVGAPFGRDAESLSQVLRRDGYDVVTVEGVKELAAAIDEHTGAVLLTDEAIRFDLALLDAAMQRQPTWSAVPFVGLAGKMHGGRAVEAAREKLPPSIANLVVLERPVGSAALVSTVASVMRARQKQFELRDRISELADSESRLRLATAAANIGTW